MPDTSESSESDEQELDPEAIKRKADAAREMMSKLNKGKLL